MQEFKIFIVEDDAIYAKILAYHLSLNPDYEVEIFHTGKELIDNLYKKPSAITLDYSLPDMSGEEVLKQIKRHSPEVPVLIISGQDNISTAVDLLRLGAYDYLVKNDDTKTLLWNSIKNLREKQNLQEEITHLREEIEQKYEFSKSIKGDCPEISQMFALMKKAVRTNIGVSISGETGTGKELIAKAVHYNSSNKKEPFIAINVAAIPKELIESELFGYEKGAFTGAISRRKGKFEQAGKGTIFLDEIGDMDIFMQAKLLRVLQEHEVVRIGGEQTIKVNARVIVSTHKNLEKEVEKGNFREDLYYRILGLPITAPPLRQRGKDVLILAKYFADEFCKKNNLPTMEIEAEAQKELLKYPFPGNVRELKAIVELACVMTNDNRITTEQLHFKSNYQRASFFEEKTTLKAYTRKIVKYFLEKYNNDITRVATELDIGKSSIYQMIKNEEL